MVEQKSNPSTSAATPYPNRFADRALPAMSGPLEERIYQIGVRMLRAMRTHEPYKRFDPADKLLCWAMNNHGFKTQLFRFIDTLPSLNSSEQVYSYLNDFLTQPEVKLPKTIYIALKASRLARPALAAATRKQIQYMAQRFIAGESPLSALPTLEKNWNRGIAFSIDLLGEQCITDKETQSYQQQYLDIIPVIAEQIQNWHSDPRLESNHLGPIPRANLSIKISSLHPHVDPIDFDGSLVSLQKAIDPILQCAEEHNVFINFDMEHYELKNLTIELFKQSIMRLDFPAGIAIQAYLCSAEEDIQSLIDFAQKHKKQFTIRLVKGAYWDHEVVHARQMNWPIPVYTKKSDADASFERAAAMIVASIPVHPKQPGINLALGTHNIRSIATVLALAEAQAIPESAIELQMLYGMASPLKTAIQNYGLRLREYVPVGAFLPGMAYLVRRLLENTSNQSWLHPAHLKNQSDEQLLASPHDPDRPLHPILKGKTT
ncbi:proline dehydrogenase family protein [Poriferisphaera sp. WC338]|uniref:proline dehydrogenase family protein n=1 Tax=Poriferisphaera sp. WC338 TaxID=3425129 RepID=UPI003D814BA6